MNIRLVAALFAGLGAAGAALAAAPSTPPEASLDLRNPGLEVQWTSDARPAPFTRVLLAPVELQFREVPPLAGPPGTPGTRSEDQKVLEALHTIADYGRRLAADAKAIAPRHGRPRAIDVADPQGC